MPDIPDFDEKKVEQFLIDNPPKQPLQISHDEANALLKVLSLAENHQMWSNPTAQEPSFRAFVEDQYAAITQVRAFLKKHGIVTMHEVLQTAARKTFDKIAKEEGEGT